MCTYKSIEALLENETQDICLHVYTVQKTSHNLQFFKTQTSRTSTLSHSRLETKYNSANIGIIN